MLQQRFPTPYNSDTLEQRLDEEPLSPFTKPKDGLEGSGDDEGSDHLEGDTLLEDVKQSGKRSAPSGRVEKRPAKRRKPNDTYKHGEVDEDSDFEGDTLLASTPGPKNRTPAHNKAQDDRQAMPPPSKPAARLDDQPYIPAKETIDRNLQNNIVHLQSFPEDSDISEDEIFTKKTAVRREDRSEVNPQFAYDRALRHAEAQKLPEDLGVWSEAEKDLFYRLAMRGFEPLIPGHWPMDFKTLPQLLFSVGTQVPLIEPFDDREFRAKHYLRTLFGIAANVRDRYLLGLRCEPSIKRTLRQFIAWALLDAGVHPTQRPKAIPVHALATKQRGETTQDVLKRMSKKLYKLARRYQDAHCVRQSIEPSIHLSTPPNSDEACFGESASGYDDAHMPTLIGLMIASSVVAIVTLDSRSTPPESLPRRDGSKRHSSSQSRVSSTYEESFGLRFIEKFDFSTHDGYDVWDGLAMAICVMRIRKTMLQLCERAETEGQAGQGGLWERVWPAKAKRVESEASE